MEVYHECDICSEAYGCESLTKPRMLPCGHVVCHSCLDKIEQTGVKNCPTCRETWSKLKVVDLPICFSLLPRKDIATPKCIKHDLGMTITCKSCVLKICRECVVDHELCSTVVSSPSELRKDMQQEIDELKHKVSALSIEKETAIQLFEECSNNVRSGCIEFRKTLPSKEQEISQLDTVVKELDRKTSVNSELLAANDEAEELQETTLSTKPSTDLLHVPNANKEDSSTAGFAVKSLPKVSGSPDTDFEQSGNWKVLDGQTAQKVLKIINTSSIRPKRVIVTVEKEGWEEDTLLELLRGLGGLGGLDFSLHFNDSCEEPSAAALETDLRRIKCVFGDKFANPKRCCISEYSGLLDRDILIKVIGFCACMGGVFAVRFPLWRGQEDLSYLEQSLLSDVYCNEIVIPQTVDASVFDGYKRQSQCPAEEQYVVTFIGLPSSGLAWAGEVSKRLRSCDDNFESCFNGIKLLRSPLKDADLDALVGVMVDYDIAQATVHSDAIGAKVYRSKGKTIMCRK